MSKMNDLILLIIINVSIIGCSTLSKEECLQGDWRSIGYWDGTRGYALERFKSHQEACTDFQISPDFSAYQVGHHEGLATVYCSPSNGFKLGEQIKDYHGVCPNHVEAAFLKQYRRGLQTVQRFNQQDIKKYEEEQRDQIKLLSYIKAEEVEQFKKVQENISNQQSNIDRLQEKDREITRLLEKTWNMRR